MSEQSKQTHPVETHEAPIVPAVTGRVHKEHHIPTPTTEQLARRAKSVSSKVHKNATPKVKTPRVSYPMGAHPSYKGNFGLKAKIDTQITKHADKKPVSGRSDGLKRIIEFGQKHKMFKNVQLGGK